MKRIETIGYTLLGLTLALGLGLPAAGAESLRPLRTGHTPDVSFRNEIQRAIDKGLTFLLASQNSNGWWSTADHPAVTALALSGFMGDPSGRYQTNPPASIQSGYAYILGSAKPDGSIYRAGLINYNTSISMMGLLAANNPAYDDILRRGRAFLVKSQVGPDTPGHTNSLSDGGVGYGDKPDRCDMDNTLTALEAIYYTRQLVSDKTPSAGRDLNWAAAIQFLQNCQNLPSRNHQAWVSDDPRDQGGFVYSPGDSKAGGRTNSVTGRVALRSYGSMSYAGLLSYIYANLQREDPRVVAVLDWLRANYTLDENPGMELQGLYYYLHLMTKGLNIYGADLLELKDGTKIDWRHEIAMRLINLQQQNGSWVNTNGRWWEKDPNLVTAYSVLSMEIIYRGI